MAQARPETLSKVDTLMEAASRALVERRYLDCERLCVEALERAFISADYERMARVLLPLEESRRQKRDLAFDAGAVFVVNDELPHGRALRAGCYLVAPPRVGVDGRLLREMANKKRVPTIIVVREPVSRDGMWPVVTIGPVTIRTKVPPPVQRAAPTGNGEQRGRGRTAKKQEATPGAAPALPVPDPEWFLRANEAIGDKALAGIEPTALVISRVEALMRLLQAHPDHEKLHQALAETCREAAKQPIKTVRTRVVKPFGEDDDE